MNRKCRKCNAIIPYRTNIKGKSVSLQNRKFCIICSPYKKRNTSPYDPTKRKSKIWREYTEERKNNIKTINYLRGLKIRDELYQKSGGKCKKCGYFRCKRSFAFHHIDRKTKSFGLTLNNLWSKKRDLIDKEWEKCELLCMNCHCELEDEISRKTSIIKDINEKYKTNY